MIQMRKKPYKIYPFWIVYILLFAFFDDTLFATGGFLGCLIASVYLHKKNVKLFGKDYKRNKQTKVV